MTIKLASDTTRSDILKTLADKWPSSIVARTEVERFSGGLINAKYISNLDSAGQGPVRVKVGRKVVYPVDSLIIWLENRRAN